MEAGIKTCFVLGGDYREIAAANELLSRGWHVFISGLPVVNDGTAQRAIYVTPDEIAGILPQVDILILPVLGIGSNGFVHRLPGMPDIEWHDEWFSLLPSGANLFIGKASEGMRLFCSRYGISLYELLSRDDFALYNAIPTAEGAIVSALTRSKRTLHGSNALVIGYGRSGYVIVEKLHGLQANVTVAARKADQRAKAVTSGCRAIPFGKLKQYAADFDYIFNTVPALVLDGDVLRQCREDAVITDIASAPGGVDFNTAKELGISAALELGLPGKVAPVSAGQAIIQTIDTILEES